MILTTIPAKTIISNTFALVRMRPTLSRIDNGHVHSMLFENKSRHLVSENYLHLRCTYGFVERSRDQNRKGDFLSDIGD